MRIKRRLNAEKTQKNLKNQITQKLTTVRKSVKRILVLGRKLPKSKNQTRSKGWAWFFVLF